MYVKRKWQKWPSSFASDTTSVRCSHLLSFVGVFVYVVVNHLVVKKRNHIDHMYKVFQKPKAMIRSVPLEMYCLPTLYTVGSSCLYTTLPTNF